MDFDNRKMFFRCLHLKNCMFVIPRFPPPPPPPPPPQREPSLILPIWICVGSSIILFIFLTICLYHYIKQPRSISSTTVAPSDTNRREEEEEETEERDFSEFYHIWRIPTVGLHRSVINSITVVVFKKGEGLIDGTECSVCLNEFEENESLRLLPKCNHAFHINCIDTWLLSHKNCPLCRAPVVHLTKPTHRETETNHPPDSESSGGRQERSRSRNNNTLPRAQSDLAYHCGSRRRVENVRRSSSIGGSLSLCDVNNVTTRSGRQFYTNFARFLSSSRRSRNQEPILPN